MNERIIKIFMASSDELESDRAIFGNLIRHLNDLYRKRGIYIELFQWEDFDASYGRGRKQEEYNEKVRESDMFLAFFHKKAGEFTVEEFDTAIEHFEKTSQPKIYTYMRDLAAGEQEEDSLTAFKKRLYNDMGHYWCRYGNSDTMKLHFVLQFQFQEENRNIIRLEVKDSKVLLDAQTVADLNQVPFAANNEAFREINQRKAKLEERIVRLRERVAKTPGDADCRADLTDALNELAELCKKLEQHEKFLFDIAKTFARQAGKACTERMQKARELFEQGKASEANGILATEDLNRDIGANLRRWEHDRERVEEDRKLLLQNVEELLLKTKTAMADANLDMRERLEQACQAYDSAIALQRKLEAPPEELAGALFSYARLLGEFKQFYDMLPLYYETLEIRRMLSERHPDAYLPDVAKTLNNLGNLHSDLQDFAMAEKKFAEALEIYRTLSEHHPDAHLPNMAVTLDNFGSLHYYLQDFATAEKEYTEALEIRRTLSEHHPDAYLPDVAKTLNNLGNLHSDLQDFATAEKEYTEALEINRALSEHHPDAYLPYLAALLNNLGFLHSDLQDFATAEKEYTEALEINRALSERNPDAYLPDLAVTLDNFGILHSNLQDFVAAEKEYTEALEIRRALSKRHPDAYLPYVAITLNNFGILHYHLQDFVAAEKEFTEALEIRRALSERHPDAYLHYVAMSLKHLGSLHRILQDFAAAERELTEALESYRVLYDKSPLQFGKDFGLTTFSFGIMLLDEKIDIDKGKQLIDEAYQIALENKEQEWSKDLIDYIKEYISYL